MAFRDCWNCSKQAHQTLRGEPFHVHGSFGDESIWYGSFQCDHCGHASVGSVVFTWSKMTGGYAKIPPSPGNVDSEVRGHVKRQLDDPDAVVRWLPDHVLGKKFDDVPGPIAEAASEAYSCHSIASYRAAILLARSVVEAVAKDKGITRGNLADKIDKLAEAQHIRALIRDSAHEIRHLGNDMAHGDFIEPTSAEDSLDVLDFMSVVLAEVYQLPTRVNARQATRAARKAAAADLANSA